MFAIQRHNRPARAGLHVTANRFAQRQQFVKNRPQLLFRTCVLVLNVLTGGLQIRLRRVLPALSLRAFRNPRCLVRSQFVLGLQPFAPGLLVLRPFPLHQREPFFDGTPGFFLLKYPTRSSTALTIKGSATVASSKTSANRPPSSGGTNLPQETASVYVLPLSPPQCTGSGQMRTP